MRSARKSAAATSAFVRPCRDQVGDAPLRRRQALGPRAAADAPQLVLRPLRPARRAHLREAGARRLDRVARRDASAGRGAGPRRARAGPARGRTGRPRPRVASTASASRATAPSTSPRAAATRPRHRVTCASTHSRSTRRALASHASRRSTASSTRPSSSSASTCSARHQLMVGSAPSAASAIRLRLGEPRHGGRRVAAPEVDNARHRDRRAERPPHAAVRGRTSPRPARARGRGRPDGRRRA